MPNGHQTPAPEIMGQIGALQAQVAAAGSALARIETRLPELSERLAISEQSGHHQAERLTDVARRLELDGESREERIAALETDRTLSGVSSGGSGNFFDALKGLDAKQVITAVLIGLALFGSAPAQQALGLSRPPDVEKIVQMLEARDRARDTGPPAGSEIRDER